MVKGWKTGCGLHGYSFFFFLPFFVCVCFSCVCLFQSSGWMWLVLLGQLPRKNGYFPLVWGRKERGGGGGGGGLNHISWTHPFIQVYPPSMWLDFVVLSSPHNSWRVCVCVCESTCRLNLAARVHIVTAQRCQQLTCLLSLSRHFVVFFLGLSTLTPLTSPLLHFPSSQYLTWLLIKLIATVAVLSVTALV